MKSFRALLGLVAFAFVMAQSQVQAATDIFARLVTPTGGAPAATGDSVNPQFKGADGWFDVSEVSYGMQNDTTIGGTGGVGAGKATILPLSCVKIPNSASAALFTACAVGGHWDTLEVVFTKTNGGTGKSDAYLRLEFKLVFVSKLGISVSAGDDSPREEVTLLYAAQRITFYTQKPDGTMLQTGQSVWSFTKNTATFTS